MISWPMQDTKVDCFRGGHCVVRMVSLRGISTEEIYKGDFEENFLLLKGIIRFYFYISVAGKKINVSMCDTFK